MGKDTMYQCLDCNEKLIVKSNDHKKDGSVCKKCEGRIIPVGYVVIGVDLASGPDRTGYPPIK